VPDLRGSRPELSPAGHPAVDQPRVPHPARLGADPKALHDSGTEPLEQDVRAFDEIQNQRDAVRLFEVHADGPFSALQEIP